LHTALRRVAADGRSHVILDGWYSGKHRDFGANVQALMRPDGLPVWTSDALPGHLHDTSWARELGVTAALNWSAAELNVPALADSGYESSGHGIKSPIKQPADNNRLAPDNRAYNRLLRGLRWRGERGFAILIGRWKTVVETANRLHRRLLTSPGSAHEQPTAAQRGRAAASGAGRHSWMRRRHQACPALYTGLGAGPLGADLEDRPHPRIADSASADDSR
jgi:hypothetical protein